MKLPADTGPSLDRDRIRTTSNADVRYWHLADIGCALHMSAFDPKRTSTSSLKAVHFEQTRRPDRLTLSEEPKEIPALIGR